MDQIAAAIAERHARSFAPGSPLEFIHDKTPEEARLQKLILAAIRRRDRAEIDRLREELRAIYHTRRPDVAALYAKCEATVSCSARGRGSR